LVEIDFETRNAQLAALMERAQSAFEHSRRVVEESRKLRAEAEAKRSANSTRSANPVQNTADGFDDA
jgi:hypothetical protein